MGLKPKKPTPSTKARTPARGTDRGKAPVRKTSAGKTRAAKKSRSAIADVDSYLASLDDSVRSLAARVRDLVRSAAPQAVESIKWAQPVYEERGPFAYVRAVGDHVNLGFWRGNELDD